MNLRRTSLHKQPAQVGSSASTDCRNFSSCKDTEVFEKYLCMTKNWIRKRTSLRFLHMFDVEQMAVDVLFSLVKQIELSRNEGWNNEVTEKLCRTIAKRRVISEIRKMNRKKRVSTNVEIEQSVGGEMPCKSYCDASEQVDEDELLEFIEHDLSLRQRQIIEFRRLGHSTVEIAALLFESTRTIERETRKIVAHALENFSHLIPNADLHCQTTP